MDINDCFGALFEMQDGARSHVELYDAIRSGNVHESVLDALNALREQPTRALEAENQKASPELPSSPLPVSSESKRITLRTGAVRRGCTGAARVKVVNLDHSKR